jgi:hypothetical protein
MKFRSITYRLRLPPLLPLRSPHRIGGHQRNHPLAQRVLRVRLPDRAFYRHLRLHLLDLLLAGYRFLRPS